MKIKGKDGAEIVLQSRGEGFVCPGCGATVATLKCVGPECTAVVPAKFCANCAYPMGFGACETCGQPEASCVATDAALENAEAARSELQVDGYVEQFRRSESELVIDGYLTGEIKDMHKTIPETAGLMRFAQGAKFDIEHNKVAIPGVSCRRGVEVRRRVEGKMTKMGRIEVVHDPKVPEAVAAFEAAERGDYRGFSAYFYIPAALDAQIKTAAARGDVTKIPASAIDSMPFISFVARPSCPVALIESFRSAPDEPEALIAEPTPPTTESPLAATGEAFDSITSSAAASVAEPTQEPQAAAPEAIEPAHVQQMRSEMAALVEQARRDVLSDVSAFLNAKVAPAIDAVLAASRKANGETLVAAKRHMATEIAKLRVAEPTHEPEIAEQERAEQATAFAPIPVQPTRNFK